MDFSLSNAGGTKRILNYLSYLFSAVVSAFFYCKRPDIIIATSPQFFCGWAGVLASWLKWTPFVLEIRDIWPESIVTVGAMKKGLAVRALETLEKWMYKSARHIVAVGNGYRDNICSKVRVSDRISVITNGVDSSKFIPADKDLEYLAKHGIGNQFVCAYVGTIGMAHGLEIVVHAAKSLRQAGRTDVVFWLVGDGARRKELEQMVDADNLAPWVRFSGLLPKAEMPKVLASCDCLLVHLKKSELFETVIPSKIFEAMAMCRPIIMGVKGEAAEIVRASQSGLEITPENSDELIETIERLCDDRDFRAQLGSRGRSFVVNHYSRDHFAIQFLKVLEDCVGVQR